MLKLKFNKTKLLSIAIFTVTYNMNVAKKKKKFDPYSFLAPDEGFLGQHFLILVAVMVVFMLSIGQIIASGRPPRHDDYGSKKYASQSVKNVKTQKTLPKVPIGVWKGPAQPLIVPPGLPPVIDRVPTELPIVFVTIDDGWVQTPENLNWLSTRRLPFSMFLSENGIKKNYQYFQTLQAAGMGVQNHSVSHHSLLKMPLDQQKAEICGASDTYQSVFRHRPTLFRPPYGEYSDTTRQAAAECGIRALVLWKATIEHGAVQFQVPNGRLNPGDIILAHFEPDLVPSLEALSHQLNQQGLQVAQLEEWIK